MDPSLSESKPTDSKSTISRRTEPEDDFRSISTTVLEPSIAETKDIATGDHAIPQPLDEKPAKGWERYYGVLYTLYAISMTSLGNNVLALIPHIHPITIGFYAFPIGIATSVPFVLYRNKILKKPVLDTLLPLSQHKTIFFLMWLRSTCTAMLTFCLCWTAKYTVTSDTRLIYATYVITVNILAALLFKEKYGFVKFFVSCIILTGIAVMTKSPILTGLRYPNVDYNLVNLVSFSSSMFCSINMLVLRYLHHIYHGVRNTFLFSWAFTVTIPFAVAFDKVTVPNCTKWDIIGIAGYGTLLSFNNIFFAWALKCEEAGTVALVRTFEIALGCFWKMIISQTCLGLISSLGSIPAMAGLFVVILRIWVDGLDENSKMKKRMRWIFL